MKRCRIIAVIVISFVFFLSGAAVAKELVIGTIGLTGDTYQLAIAWSNLMLKKGEM